MIIQKHDIILRRNGILNIYQHTDAHYFSEGHDKVLHKRFVSKVARDPDARWIDTGDLTDDDRPSTRERRTVMYLDRAEARVLEDNDHRNRLDKTVIPKLRPIADKCLGLLAGDHFRIYANGDNSAQYIARELKVPYLGERMAFASLRVSTVQRPSSVYIYNILARHGKGGPSTSSGDVAGLVRQNTNWDADLYLGGHTHKENAHPEPFLGVNGKRGGFNRRTRWYIRGGSFLCGFAVGTKQHYPEKNEYGPLCLGWGELHLQFGRPAWNDKNLAVVHSMGCVNVG